MNASSVTAARACDESINPCLACGYPWRAPFGEINQPDDCVVCKGSGKQVTLNRALPGGKYVVTRHRMLGGPRFSVQLTYSAYAVCTSFAQASRYSTQTSIPGSEIQGASPKLAALESVRLGEVSTLRLDQSLEWYPASPGRELLCEQKRAGQCAKAYELIRLACPELAAQHEPHIWYTAHVHDGQFSIAVPLDRLSAFLGDNYVNPWQGGAQ